MDRKDAGHTAEPGGEELGLGGQGSRVPMTCPCRVPGPGSPFRDEITLAILQLQENNRLEILKRKWWEGGRCPKEEDHRAKGQLPPRALPFPEAPHWPAPALPARPDPWLSPSTPGLGMENIGGIFVVLICGLIIAVFVAVMEFIWSTRRSAESEEVRRLLKGLSGEVGPRRWRGLLTTVVLWAIPGGMRGKGWEPGRGETILQGSQSSRKR